MKIDDLGLPSIVVVLGLDRESISERLVTPRAVAMTGGIFQFAEMVNRKESDQLEPEGLRMAERSDAIV